METLQQIVDKLETKEQLQWQLKHMHGVHNAKKLRKIINGKIQKLKLLKKSNYINSRNTKSIDKSVQELQKLKNTKLPTHITIEYKYTSGEINRVFTSGLIAMISVCGNYKYNWYPGINGWKHNKVTGKLCDPEDCNRAVYASREIGEIIKYINEHLTEQETDLDFN